MATYRTVGNGIRAEVCVNGKRKSKVLPTKTDAKIWAAETESELRGNTQQQTKLTVSDMWTEWQKRYQDDRKLFKWGKNKINNFHQTKLTNVLLCELDTVHVAKWRAAARNSHS